MNKISTTNQLRRRAFTLVELLLVVSIIAVIASLSVGVLAQAQNDAAIAATRSRITLIEKILEVELEDYEVRRSPVSFAGISSLIGASTLDNSPTDKTLLHARNLKRMIIADLIRAELPDGSRPDDDGRISQFPSDTLLSYLAMVGVGRQAAASLFPTENYDTTTGDFDSLLPSVDFWSTWTAYDTRSIGDASILDGIDDEASDKSELLYQILLNIDVDGVPAVDQLAQAIGDTDEDGVLEIVDAWGEPLFLQWQQEWPTLAPAPTSGPDVGKSPINLNVWDTSAPIPPSTAGGMGGLSKEHIDLVGSPNPPQSLYCKPVLPTQIRPFLVSERLIAVDGPPVDYQIGVDFSD